MYLKFKKYQSLGNDFIVFDWQDVSESEILIRLSSSLWSSFVRSSCQRHTGVGADGILIIKQGRVPEVLIFNADGTQAELCLNGLRCVADYLYMSCAYPEVFSLLMGGKDIECLINKDTQEITNKIVGVTYLKKKTIDVGGKKLTGHMVDVKNPHFVIFERGSLKWLQEYGRVIETHPVFLNKTNVEFVWQHDNVYHMLVYERGCGITQACSSGVAAVTYALNFIGSIQKKQHITICMLGGNISSWVDVNALFLKTKAQFVFHGMLNY